MAEPSHSHRVTVSRNPAYAAEAEYIQAKAKQRTTCIVRLGPIIFFSTAGGDAWMIDAREGEASCLARVGAALPAGVQETSKKLWIEWQGRYRLEDEAFVFVPNDGGAQTFLEYPVGEIRRLIDEHPLEGATVVFDDEALENRLRHTGRNDPCPCGSGRKYKKCCLANDEAAARQSFSPRDRPDVRRAELGPPSPGDGVVIDLEPVPDAAEAKDPGGTEMGSDGQDEPELAPEVDAALDAIWDEFDRQENPTTEDMNLLLERLMALPPEATSWNDLFQRFVEHEHADLAGVFWRIAAGVRPTPGAALSFFYWSAIETFVRRKQVELVPEVVKGFCTLDRETYDADALEHVQWWAMAAGCEAGALGLAERFCGVVRADTGLMPYSAAVEARLLFELRVGGRLRESAASGTDPANLAVELRRGIEDEIHSDHARRAADVICGVAPVRGVTRQDFDLPISEVREGSRAWSATVDRFEVLMRVAREAWESRHRPPGIAFCGLQMLVDAMYADLNERPKKLKSAPLNLLDVLDPGGMERRLARHTRDIMGTNEPKAQILIEAHIDLLRFAVSHGLIEAPLTAKSEANIALLQAKLCFPP